MKTQVVKMKDRIHNVHEFQILLQTLGVSVDYPTTELIYKGVELYNKKSSALNLMDVSKLRAEWGDKWDRYFEELNPLSDNE